MKAIVASSVPAVLDRLPLEQHVFGSPLGWFLLLGSRETPRSELAVEHLSFGHAGMAAALDASRPLLAGRFSAAPREEPLVERLQAYAAGTAVDLSDVPVVWRPRGEFARLVIELCREIGFGETCTYQELAERAGSPRAARAVGNTMASNQVPIIVPCHRVVGAGGGWGGYSAPGGVSVKQRLLTMEAAALAAAR